MNYIHQSNVLIFPNYPQTWGLTALEAIALGVPTIVSDGSGVSEVLKDKQHALIYPKGSVSKLYKAMLYCLKNRKGVSTMSKSGQIYVLSRFTWARYADEVVLITQSIL